MQTVQCGRLREKLVFVTSVTSVLMMVYALVSVQWLLPYYYAVSAPLLIGLRICLYMYICFCTYVSFAFVTLFYNTLLCNLRHLSQMQCLWPCV